MNVVKRNGDLHPLDIGKIEAVLKYATEGLEGVSTEAVKENAAIMFFDGIETKQIHNALIQSAAELISVDAPNYTFVASRLVLQTVFKEIMDGKVSYSDRPIETYIIEGVKEGRLSEELLTGGFDFVQLDEAINPENDKQITYLGMLTLADRYLIRAVPQKGEKDGKLLEMPQHMLMRIAMGLALNETVNRTEHAIAFYKILSSFDYMSSTPTLFNSGTPHSQMSSCYLNSMGDSISNDEGEHRYNSIYGTIEECARLSKFAGGIGTDWTNVRPAGSLIKSTNGKSSGIVPYVKVWADTAVAVNQGGKRNGAFAAYLEPWHADFLRFCDLKKNAGDEHLRARDIFTAGWTPDLFMERVRDEGQWSFFSSNECPELHATYGEEFKYWYEKYEAEGKAMATMPAVEVWRYWLQANFESGGPWITFKDESNRRNPQDHVGIINNSNLCTEITLNTSGDETAVCNLGSINASRFVTPEGKLNKEKLRSVVKVAMRMLDNVIDINFYPSDRARNANLRHRPVGLGVMGWAEYVVQRGVDWESDEHLQLTDEFFEHWSYYAIEASMELAKERGAYETFQGSKWSRGILPIDTARDLSYVTRSPELDWDQLRADVVKYGMRNSNTMAIAPTATIANITGTTPCIELPYDLQYEKENHSGLFTVVSSTLNYGRPELCKTAFEVDQEWVIKPAAVRQRWIDQSQSTNLYAKIGTKGRDLSKWYMLAWTEGLKTTYYLRRQTKEQDDKTVGQPKTETVLVSATEEELIAMAKANGMDEEVVMCSIDNPDCEACQ